MSIFKQRTMRPNQLATMRSLESRVNVGRVLYCKDNLAIVTGVNADAPLGTLLTFVSGGVGVLLWHRSDNLAFALILGGAFNVSVGEGVECKVKGILQVLDDEKGPITKKEYECFQSPTGESMFGHVVDHLGRPAGPSRSKGVARLGMEKTKPLINQQVAMKNREPITESLFTGVKAVDTLTPLGRGASLLVVGPKGSGKTSLVEDAMLGQLKSGVRCVYAATGVSEEQVTRTYQSLKANGAMAGTTIVWVPPEAPLGERYAALCTACSLGERIRDEGGSSLVILDDLRPLLEVWETLVLALVALGKDKIREGLIKDGQGRDVQLSPQTEEELVEYEGMLVSGAAAQRRGFFSTLFMRAAKLHKALGGGSMTLMPVVPGRPASGQKSTSPQAMPKYSTLTAEQQAKIEAALKRKAEEEERRRKEEEKTREGELPTEAVEEFISIADGQAVLQPTATEGYPYEVNPRLSITRIGTRAYSRAMADVATSIRLNLAQAEDAKKFAINATDPLVQKYSAYTSRISTALLQKRASPVPLADLVIILYAIQRGYADHVSPPDMPLFIMHVLNYTHQVAAHAVQEVENTRQLTATAEEAIRATLEEFATSKVV